MEQVVTKKSPCLTGPRAALTIIETIEGGSFGIERHGDSWRGLIVSGEGTLSFRIPRMLAAQLVSSCFTKNKRNREIERRWKCTIPEDIEQEVTPSLIQQWYLLVGTDLRGQPVEVRVRDNEGELSLTIKKGKGISRNEIEGSLASDAISADDLRQFPFLRKLRYSVPQGDVCIEYNRMLDGVCADPTAEIEFSTRKNAEAFIAPSHFGNEVTDDSHYESVNLAKVVRG